MKSIAEAMAVLRYSMRCKAARQGMFALLAMATVCLVIASAWWWPAEHEQAQLLRDIGARRAAIVEAARADEVARAHRKASLAVALFEKKLEMHAGQADLIQGIARLASQRGVHVVSQSFDEGRVQRGDAALYLELGLVGDYTSLRRLLGDFATLPMWLEVVEARIESTSGAQVRAQVRLLTYRVAKERP